MKLWIMYDTQFGNGKKLAELLKNECPQDWEINTGDVKEISGKKVAEDAPDALILGGAIRMFRGCPKSKQWVKDLDSALKASGHKISYGTAFITHGLPTDKIQGWKKRYWKVLQKANNIGTLYSDALTARVKTQEGPILDEELDKSKQYAKDFCSWITQN